MCLYFILICIVPLLLNNNTSLIISLNRYFFVYSADNIEISAQKAVLLDLKSRQVLYDKHMDIKSFPASLTKVLTTIVAIEEGKLDDIVTVSKRAAYQEGSSIYLKAGEKIKLKELLYGIMLASGNDASIAVAEYISGSVEEFAKLLNKKAIKMGAIDSNFVNPSGLPDPDHYSTAYDIAMIMCYAMKNRVFRDITKTKYKTISWAGNDWGRGLRNHNKLLWSYDDIIGGKTGYTKAAGRCLLSTSAKNKRELVAVVLNAPDDWLDMRKLLDYGYDNFKYKMIYAKNENVYNLKWENSLEGNLGLLTIKKIRLLIPKNGRLKFKKEILIKEGLTLPIKKGEYVGDLKISNDRFIVKTKLIAENDLNFKSIFLRLWNRIIN